MWDCAPCPVLVGTEVCVAPSPDEPLTGEAGNGTRPGWNASARFTGLPEGADALWRRDRHHAVLHEDGKNLQYSLLACNISPPRAHKLTRAS